MSDGAAVIVLGDAGRTHGRLHDYTAVEPAAAIAAARFDNDTDTWSVTTADGPILTARMLVDTTPSADDVVAVHGVPNRFRIPRPHTERQARYVARLIDGLNRGRSTRIEARSRVRVRRRLPTRGLTRFYLSGTIGVNDEVYDGPAVLTHDDRDYPVRARLTGHLDPIDGRYHWQGTLFASVRDNMAGAKVSIRIGEHTAAGKISEQTPWGTLSVVGSTGYPPFSLEHVEIAMPPRL